MEDLFKILPDIIIYLASGFAFIAGFYFLIDRRFDFFTEISFSIMLVLGFVCTNVLQALPVPYVIENVYYRNILIVIISGLIGLFAALIRNLIGERINKFVVKFGRRKTPSDLFWYDRLDTTDKPVWLRLINHEKNYMLEGVLLSLDEAKENPYLLLGYCKRYDLNGNLLDDQYSDNKCVQCVVRADTFQEILFIYAEDSSKPIELTMDVE